MKDNHIFRFLFVLPMVMLLAMSNIHAQCDYSGVVLTNGSCTNLFIEEVFSGTTFEVNDDGGFDITEGDSILFSFEMANASSCTGFLPINLTCVAPDTSVFNSCEVFLNPVFFNGGTEYFIEYFFNSQWTPVDFQWLLNDSIVGTGDYFSGTSDDYGQELCLTVVMVTANGSSCVSSSCVYLDFLGTSTCVDSSLIDPNVQCPTEYAPVCGCDSVTYNNECEAFYYGGVMSYSPGACMGGGCDVSFDAIQQSNPNEYVFTNTTPNSTFNFWMISDGSFMENSSSFSHVFPGDGSYMVCLLAGDTQCDGSMCQIIMIGDSIQMPIGSGFVEYVYPGDADANGVADLNDVLYVGLGYDSSGFPRPNASDNWEGQMSFDWTNTLAGVNYKHFDCNGDGEVDYVDVNSILVNSHPMPATTPPTDVYLPSVYLDFVEDTIIINDGSPTELTVSANLMVGSGLYPVYDLAGLSVGLNYPKDLVNKPAVVDYADNSFLGSSNELLWVANDYNDASQLDMAFVRNDHTTKSGYGKVAIVDIIIDDIIYLRTGKYIEVDININTVKALDSLGNVMELSVENGGTSTVVFVNNTTVATLNPTIQNNVTVYPSPAKDEVFVAITDLHLSYVEVYDLLSQKVYSAKKANSTGFKIEMNHWASGQYIIKCYTEEGLVVKRVVKE